MPLFFQSFTLSLITPQSHRGLMLRRPWLFALLFIALAFSAPAQQVDASNTGGPTRLDAPWRLQFGDDPAYAQPGFDDSDWTLHRIEKDWASAGRKGYAGYAWYRMRVILPKGNESLAIAIYPPANAVEVYIDGALAGTIGRMRPEPVQKYLRTAYSVAVPPALNGRSVELAMRAWESPLAAPSVHAGAAAHPPLLGTAGDVSRIVSLEQQNFWVAAIPGWAEVLVEFCAGVFSFGLFLLQRQAREYAYAAAFFCSGLANGLWPVAIQSEASFRITQQAVFTTFSVGLICLLLFTWGFVGARADRLLYACLVVGWGDAIGITLVNLGFIPYAGSTWIWTAMHGFLSIAVFVRLYTLARRGNRDAQLLLIPFFFFWAVYCVVGVLEALATSGIADLRSALILYHNPRFNIYWQDFFALLSDFAIGAVLVLRFTRSAKQEQRLRTEMEAARRVQGQLVPADLPQLAAFACDAAYRAAGEVGGDFYQVFPRPDGSALVVVGDVSGKGLRAAMFGTLLVGAANALAKENLPPAQMLSRLNESLYGQTDGGFATCLCALLAPNGELSIANAGHLSPYRNGRELPCEPGLPLGILPAADYMVTRVQLAPDDALTFISDGVVEARSAGGELFGFDRMRDISAQSAQQIADAAARFGQEDDITVLTFRLSAVAAVL
jgi:hypothetical protein